MNLNNKQKDSMIREIASYYGLENQIIQTAEEVGELLQALSKYKRLPAESRRIALAEEIADVRIMLNQIAYLANINFLELNYFTEEKLKRQVSRIHAEQVICEVNK